jgi:hypothetical protein
MTEGEQHMDEKLYPVVMQEIQDGNWKKQFTEAAQENSVLKKASIVVFTIMYRMPQTLLEYAAEAKFLAARWKGLPIQNVIESQDLFQMMEKSAATRNATDWMMPYLDVLAKLQTRPPSQAAKLAVQRFVEFFETGISDGELRSALKYFQAVNTIETLEYH